jgi:pimeloyl-ACP methyl ester carboxylesterase
MMLKFAKSPTKLRIATAAITLLAAGVGTVLTGASSSQAAGPTADRSSARSLPASAPKPTVVLVHGAFADATGWKAEISQLRRLGYPVVAPPNPLRGLTSDSDYLRAYLRTISGPMVLVGHSYGGAVITNAARGVENVKALVYVAAFMPDEGLNINNSYDPTVYPGALLGPDTTTVVPVANAAAPGGQDVDIYIKPDKFRAVFAGDQSAQTALTMAATQRPLTYTANVEPSGAPAWKTIPSWALITLKDKAIAPGGQEFMAHRAHATIRTVNSAHDVMISHPRTVVSLIRQAASSIH